MCVCVRVDGRGPLWKVSSALRGHAGDVHDLAWSPDGSALVSGSVENWAMLWDVEGRRGVVCAQTLRDRHIQSMHAHARTSWASEMSRQCETNVQKLVLCTLLGVIFRQGAHCCVLCCIDTACIGTSRQAPTLRAGSGLGPVRVQRTNR